VSRALISRQQESIVQEFVARKEAGLPLDAQTIRLAAAAAGTNERTLYRWIEQGTAQRKQRDRFTAGAKVLELYFACTGNASLAYVKCLASPRTFGLKKVPDLRTFQRAINRELSPGERAYAAKGEKGRRNHRVYTPINALYRNHMVIADHTKLKIKVIPTGLSKELMNPWLTLFQDEFSRGIRAAIVSLRPDSGDVAAGLRTTILGNPKVGPFCGLPDMFRFDNGTEFLATSIAETAATLGIAAVPCRPYSPHEKGKIERLNRTIKQEFLADKPLVAGPRKADGRLYGSYPAGAMHQVEFEAELEAWVFDYNHKRAQSVLGGLTPVEAWEADVAPIRMPADADLIWLGTQRVTRTIQKSGLQIHNRFYVAPELSGRGGEKVDVFSVRNDPRWVWVQLGKEFVCKADWVESMDSDQLKVFHTDRKASEKRASSIRREVSLKQRAATARKRAEEIDKDMGTERPPASSTSSRTPKRPAAGSHRRAGSLARRNERLGIKRKEKRT
jgi:putative transposase